MHMKKESHMTKAVSIVGILLAALFVMTASLRAQDGREAKVRPKQVYCPVTPEEEIDAEVFTEYKAQRIYFCCERCKARFERDPERYITRLISRAHSAEPPASAPRDEAS